VVEEVDDEPTPVLVVVVVDVPAGDPPPAEVVVVDVACVGSVYAPPLDPGDWVAATVR
jgi:hypothetical protein